MEKIKVLCIHVEQFPVDVTATKLGGPRAVARARLAATHLQYRRELAERPWR